MPRSLPEWRGKTPDTPVPSRVRARVFLAYEGKCYRTGIRLKPGHWQLDHIIALANGGLHAESNLAPICTVAHRAKTADDVKLKAKIQRIQQREAGIRKPRSIKSWRRFNGEPVRHDR